MNTDKNRNWTFIHYEEHGLEVLVNYLNGTGLPYAISPLHDRDYNPDGTLKKPHWHCIVMFPGPTTYNKVNSLCTDLNASIPKRILSVVGIYRYFTHKDNPEKAQYDELNIITGNGFDIKDIKGMTTSELLACKKQIIDIILSNNISEYSSLVDYLLFNELIDLFGVVSNNTIFFNTYLTSFRNKSYNEFNKTTPSVL